VSAVFVLRHAPSEYSAAYRVNGDPAVNVRLTAEGEAACRAARADSSPGSVATCVSNAFARCRSTAELLMGGRAPVLVHPRLNELDYGTFESGEFVASIPITNRSLPARGAAPSVPRPARNRLEFAQPTAAA
jgi:broad specificity phosphatase PhoE